MQYVYAVLPWVLIFGVFWFFLIRPQRQKQKKHDEMLDNLEVGDRIVTIGGIKGKVIKIKDNMIRLRISSNVDIDVLKSAIGQMDQPKKEEKEVEEKTEKEEEKEE